MHPAPVGELTPSDIPPLRIIKSLPGRLVRNNTETSSCDASLVFDFGQMLAGFCSLELDSSWVAGTRVVMRHSELIDDGNSGHTFNIYYPRGYPNITGDFAGKTEGLMPCSMQAFYQGKWGFGCANMTDAYIAAGPSTQPSSTHYTPSFTYHGFRYVEIFGLPKGYVPSPSLMTAHIVHTDLPRIGTIVLPEVAAEGVNTSGTPDILNRIHRAAINSQLSNTWSIPTGE